MALAEQKLTTRIELKLPVSDRESNATRIIEVEPEKAIKDYLSVVPGDSQRFKKAEREMPRPGGEFLGFRIVEELGRGAFGRVFLAHQIELSDRPVALKVSVELAGEVRKLARLQHTNIVPVYSAHRSQSLQALCMPYFGGTTLSDVLSEMSLSISCPTSGKQFVSTLRLKQTIPENGAEAAPMTSNFSKELRKNPDSPTLKLLESMTFVDAVLWIVSRLADGLAHAHERGIVHRDVKPANVLLTADGQPMLLDFNLAEDAAESRAAEKAKVGGTLPYMSPEQIRAFCGQPSELDGRTDIYSLGIVLFQLLARRMPFRLHGGPTREAFKKMLADRAGPAPFVRPHNADISPAVEAIVRKCLAPDVIDRYRSAADLKEDIDRHRADLPLKHTAEPSRRERVEKWLRRHPWVASPATGAAFAAAILLAAVAGGVQLSLAARAHEQDVLRQEALTNYEDFLRRADGVKHATASDPARAAEGVRHGVETLTAIGAFEPGWDEKPAVALLPPVERERLRGEVGELAFILARAASLAGAETDTADRLNRLAGNALSADAKALVAAQRAELEGKRLAADDLSKLVESLKAATADGGRSTYLRASDLAARGEYREALPFAESFASRHPDDFGGWYVKARCHDGLGQYPEAFACYGTCIALRPHFARAYFCRGELALRHGRDLMQSKADLDRAVHLEPESFDYRFTRALTSQAMRANAEALVDLNVLAAAETVPVRVWFIRALVREAIGDVAGAADDRKVGMKSEPSDAPSYLARGLARAESDPAAALGDFEAAERLDPRYAEALVNQAWILGEKLNRPADAIEAVDRLLKFVPDHQNGRAGRAVLLARLGKTDESIAEARKCLKAASDAASTYQAACVFSIVSLKEPKFRDEGVRLVARALRHGFGHDFVLTDADLNPLRDNPGFAEMMNGIKAMATLGK